MSTHVGSRWYRSPEICLIEDQYDQASDMWSFGCILYELIGASRPDLKLDRILFKGDSCYPLSPVKQNASKVPRIDEKDQMKTIMKNIGKLGEGDVAHITESDTHYFLHNITKLMDPSR